MDELFTRLAKSAAARTSSTLGRWFDNFRWVEFTTAVGAAYGSGLALGAQLGVGGKSQYIAGLGALIGAICYVRNPKKKTWSNADGSFASQGETCFSRTDTVSNGSAADRRIAAIPDTPAIAPPAAATLDTVPGA